jgi:spore maturation protein SpmB
LDLTGRTITILALMCLISHNLAVETAVQKKTGTSFGLIMVVRLCASFAGAFVLNLLLPADSQQQVPAAGYGALASAGLWVELKAWALTVVVLCAKIMILITLLMILQRILEAFGVIQWVSRFLKYPLMAFGLPRQAAFLWIVANTLGLAYGAGVIIDHVERGRLSRNHTDILNYHIAVSHSLLEDTLLFVAIGASIGWITIPRVILAGIVVWIKRGIDRLRLHGRGAVVP